MRIHMGSQCALKRVGRAVEERRWRGIARKADDYYYAQVAMTILSGAGDDRSTEDREYRPFEHVRDNYPKYLFTLDTLLQKRDGVRHVNLVDFISSGQELQG